MIYKKEIGIINNIIYKDFFFKSIFNFFFTNYYVTKNYQSNNYYYKKLNLFLYLLSFPMFWLKDRFMD